METSVKIPGKMVSTPKIFDWINELTNMTCEGKVDAEKLGILGK